MAFRAARRLVGRSVRISWWDVPFNESESGWEKMVQNMCVYLLFGYGYNLSLQVYISGRNAVVDCCSNAWNLQTIFKLSKLASVQLRPFRSVE